MPDLTQVTFLGGSLSGDDDSQCRIDYLPDRYDFWYYAICANQESAGTQGHAGCFPDHLGNLQDLSFPAGQIPHGFVGSDRYLYDLLLWRSVQECLQREIVIILICSIVGILGSYVVAWFGIRINTVANSRAAFASLSGDPLNIVNICLRSGMSVGLLLVSIELFFMIIILAYIPKELAGPCFIGFAIGESLGASALRICGGIFTKIADIGSDLMKIVFHLPEDDPKNPGVIADCTGDNAGDSVGPTADGFETYGVTGVALIAFLALALAGNPEMGGKLIVWIFAMRILMILTSLVSYFVNDVISKAVICR